MRKIIIFIIISLNIPFFIFEWCVNPSRQMLPIIRINNIYCRGSNLTVQLANIKNVPVYPWRNEKFYIDLCDKLRDTTKKFKGPPIIHNGFPGGLGHKSISILYSITQALISKRRILCKNEFPLINS